MSYQLPLKAQAYLHRLSLHYKQSKQSIVADLISSSRYIVIEETDHDNWNGGSTGHDLILYSAVEQISKIDPRSQIDIGREICEQLNLMSGSVNSEYFSTVHLEIEDENDPRFQSSRPVVGVPTVNPDVLSFWKPGLIRVFISHRDSSKADANSLASILESYGMACFVAHDTILPMAEWQKEIMKGLLTMEVMLLFITDGFSESAWVNQEIGFALGKGVPIISMKLGREDPTGFVANAQALRGRLDALGDAASRLLTLIAKTTGASERMVDALVEALARSPNFDETRARFDRLRSFAGTLTENQLRRILAAFSDNDQLYKANYLTSRYNRLTDFLNSSTGRKFEIKGKEIIDTNDRSPKRTVDDDIPF